MNPCSSAPEEWACDCEWGFRGGLIDHESAWEPVVFCVVGLRTGRRFWFWGRDPRLQGFFREHRNDLFVSHSNVAEIKYLLRLGITIPAHWFDTFAAERYLTNRPNHLEAGLSVALHRLNLPHLAPSTKKALKQNILNLQFDPENPEDRREIDDYCFSDCDGTAAHYNYSQTRIAADLMAYWVEYLKAVAKMELRGIPIAVPEHVEIQQRKPEIQAALIGDINRTWPVFIDNSFNKASFLTWCRHVGIQWPVAQSEATDKPYFVMDDDTFKAMETRHPFIAEIREVRKTLAKFGQRDLIVDPVTGRHYFNTMAFRSVTGRNQPKNFIFSGPKWLRFEIVPESPDHVLVYVDYVAQEIAIAATLSGDPAMLAIYESSDCHMAAAIRAGAARPGRRKIHIPESESSSRLSIWACFTVRRTLVSPPAWASAVETQPRWSRSTGSFSRCSGRGPNAWSKARLIVAGSPRRAVGEAAFQPLATNARG